MDPQRYWPFFEAKHPSDIIVTHMDRELRRFVSYIDKRPDWQLVYVEGIMLIYVKRGVFPLSPDLDGYQDQLRKTDVAGEDVYQLKKYVSDGRVLTFNDWIDPPPVYAPDGVSGMTLFMLGYDGAGLKKVIAGLGQDHVAGRDEALKVLRHLKKKTVR
jgi:hypothetical protein